MLMNACCLNGLNRYSQKKMESIAMPSLYNDFDTAVINHSSVFVGTIDKGRFFDFLHVWL